MQLITNNKPSVSFQAKFLHSESLKQLADYAVEHNKFEKLNQARKNIDNSFLTTRLRLDISKSQDGFPVVSFTRFQPKKTASTPYELEDYVQTKTVKFEASRKMNPLKFALEKFIKLGNKAPHNNMYKNIVKD